MMPIKDRGPAPLTKRQKMNVVQGNGRISHWIKDLRDMHDVNRSNRANT